MGGGLRNTKSPEYWDTKQKKQNKKQTRERCVERGGVEILGGGGGLKNTT